jgi:hypothetical protein
MHEAGQQLIYGRAPAWSRRRLLRWTVVPAVALLIGWAVSRYGHAVVQHLRARELQRRCPDYAPAAGRAIYDNDGDGDGEAPVAALEKYCTYRNGPYEAYQRPNNGRGPYQLMLVAFMGRRTSPGGSERLVTIPFLEVPPGDPPAFLQYIFEPQVEIPATLLRRPARATIRAFQGDRLELFAAPGHRLRILEGRPDPADACHFTIDYVHNGIPGTIDGWLNDDDSVTLGPRAGEFVEQSSTFLRWSPVSGALPSGLRMRSPAVVDATTRPVLPKKADPRFKWSHATTSF